MKQFLNKIREGSFSLGCLNSAQFLGALNDNIFKLVVIFLLIQKEGAAEANAILSLVGVLFVAPFILFSSTAGILADRFSKQKLLMSMKIAEIVLMILAIFAFAYKSVWGSYLLLFILATHSALFGPSKYSIIPEIVPQDKISRANGIVTSFTYLAIIIGTFLASFLTEITNRNFVLIAIGCLLIAGAGFISTLGIKHTKAQHPEKKFNPLFIREIYYTLRYAKQIKHLIIAICGSAFFLFIGAFVQLNIIPFALNDLHLNDVAGGYLFLATALGIVFGSLIAGKALKKKIELGLSCLAGFGIFIFLLLLWLFSFSLSATIISLVFLGICGGLFLVPFDTFIQTVSPNEKRGQIIGAVNFLSFLGVLLASFALYFFSSMLHLTAGQGFAMVGMITLLGTLLLTTRLSDLSLGYFAHLIIRPFFHLKTKEIIQNGRLYTLYDAAPIKALLLLTVNPHIHFLISKGRWSWLSIFCYSIHQIDGKFHSQNGVAYCIYLKKGKNSPLSLPTKPIVIEKLKSQKRVFHLHSL